MPNQDNSADAAPNSKSNSKYTAKSEIERVFSVFETFKKVVHVRFSFRMENAKATRARVSKASALL